MMTDEQRALLHLIARHLGDTPQADSFIADAIEEGLLSDGQHTASVAWDEACKEEGAR